MPQIRHAALSDIGRQRPTNQDRCFADPEQGLYIVADGMADELAPEIVVNTLPRMLRDALKDSPEIQVPETARLVKAALIELSGWVREESDKMPGHRGMGSTVVLALVRGNRALIAHLGDSRAYLWRGGALERLTRDQSLVQLLLDCGRITAEQAAHHPAIGELACYVGMVGKAILETRLVELQPGDQLLLCSDGLTSMLGDETITELLRLGLQPEEAVPLLIAKTNEAGGLDNVTALMVAVSD